MPQLKGGQSLCTRRSQAACRVPIKPFVCSTFRDFHVERDFLRDEVFPKLDNLCRQRGSSFTPVDLRWNSSHSQVNTEHTLRLCLDSIGRCAPFFICLLGERYGVHCPAASEVQDPATTEWMGRNFETAAACGYEWVLEEEYSLNSLTELEVIQASFRKKYDYGYFYFRDPSHIDDKLLETEPDQHESLLTDHKSESEYASRKIKELKQQIIDTGLLLRKKKREEAIEMVLEEKQKLGRYTQPLRANRQIGAQYLSLPPELQVRYFKTPEELGELVMRDWIGIVDFLYPVIDRAVFSNTESETFQQWAAHETFAAQRRSVFIRTAQTREVMDLFSMHGEVGQDIKRKTSMVLSTALLGTFMTSLPSIDSLPPILVIVGEKGCGKSTIVSNWLKNLYSSHPHLVILPHYVACSSTSTNAAHLMRRCTSELRLHYLDSDHDYLNDTQEIVDFTRVTQAFKAALALGPSILVIDGVDQLGAAYECPTYKVKEMDWLPEEMPSFCRLIITTTKADITYRALSRRADAYCIHVPQLFDARARKSLLAEYVGANYQRFLDANRVTRICSAELAHSPLFYVALANELRVLGVHKNAERLLESYVHASTFADLWTAILRRWTHDYGWLRPVSRNPASNIKAQVSRDRANNGWVADALRLLCVSRDGLSEAELLASLRVMGYSRLHEVTSAHWELFRLVTEHSLMDTSSGRLSFSHEAIRGAAECVLLGNLTSPSREKAVSPFHETWERHKQQCHAVLANFFSQQPLTARTVDELPWHQSRSGDWDGLLASVSTPGLFVKLVACGREERRLADAVGYWKTLTDKGRRPEEALRAMAAAVQEKLSLADDENDSNTDRGRIVSSAVSMATTEELPAVEEVCKKSDEEGYSQIQTAALLFFVWKFLAEMEAGWKVDGLLVTCYRLAYPVASVRDLPLLCGIQEALGDGFTSVSEPAPALLWFGEALKTAGEIARTPGGEDHAVTIGRLLDKMALSKLGDVIALQFDENTSRSRASSRVSRVKSASSGTKRAEDGQSAEEVAALLAEALKHMELAGVFPGKAAVRLHMGLLALRQRRRQDGELLLRQALDMRHKWYGLAHPLVAQIIDALATLLSADWGDAPDLAEAEDLYRKALRMREGLLGKSHADVASTLFNLGKLLQAKGTRDSLHEAKQLLQRALDIRTARLGVYHEHTKAIRRLLMTLETVDVAAKYTSRGASEPLALGGGQRSPPRSSLSARSPSKMTLLSK